jgi:N-acetylglucosaminyldiphosphoundecaprenol N-acetyl-beta-D-mannosaminyltransferase
LSRFSVQGTFVHATTLDATTNTIERYLEERQPRQIVTVNVDFLTIAESLPEMKEVINRSSLAVTDGAPLVWIARYLGFRHCQRITGPDLMEAAARLSAKAGIRIFLLGGSNGAGEATRRVLEERYPGVLISGCYAPPESNYPFPPELDQDICNRIRDCRPDVLFVAFGCPKQDFWIRDHLDELGVPVCAGIGGSFNFFAGSTPRAPRWMQRSGLEWVYRLGLEPRRLWRRYLLRDLPFVLQLAWSEIIAKTVKGRGSNLRLESDISSPT